MKIGILQCDDVQKQLQPKHGNYPEMFQELFLAEDALCEFQFYRVLDGIFPQTTHECDAWLITGSRYSAYDALPWIPALKKFVQRLYQEKRKLIGICFGHQVMAEALGGKVTLSEKGWGVCMSFNKVCTHKHWMEPAREDFNLLVSHQDQVTTLPADAQILAGSDFCPNYMIQYGDHFLSIQGHPEFSPTYAKELMLTRQDRIPADRIGEGLESLSYAPDKTLAAQWLLRFMSR
ncbi:glutamine amidotransferase-related protein [Sansalvadorimonas verongulae]|uniref:glutamine amidotransferase-related protein n=1 Tax=Sansalvadorimonas verongulae TaxID=2172824 RepID=UPI0012BC370A|nr:GMP synthase [Sansalvadorimonas verongulae]MTI12719.1 GMP synthase [Sansalvadorimonas verongulae]